MCGELAYLVGGTTGVKGTCVSQPVCASNQYLAGGTATREGICIPCANIECGALQYRTGKCSGKDNGFICNVCSNLHCPPGQQQKER